MPRERYLPPMRPLKKGSRYLPPDPGIPSSPLDPVGFDPYELVRQVMALRPATSDSFFSLLHERFQLWSHGNRADAWANYLRSIRGLISSMAGLQLSQLEEQIRKAELEEKLAEHEAKIAQHRKTKRDADNDE